jgi:hypothetical protein
VSVITAMAVAMVEGRSGRELVGALDTSIWAGLRSR